MTTTNVPTVTELPAETINFAHRMFDAARNGDSPILLQAIDAGLPPNLTNDGGNTLLMLAAYANHPDLVAALLDRGADPNRLNDRGQSPIAGAVFKGSDAVVRTLVERGADPRAGTPNAIQSARMFGRTDLLEALGAKEGEGTDVPPGVGPPPQVNGH